MAATLTRECLRLDRTWADAEHARWMGLVEKRRGPDWYHRVAIEDAAGRRLETPGIHPCLGTLAVIDAHGFPPDFRGKTVLDVGCNAGFYAFVAKLRGAKRVLAIEVLPHYFQQALLLRDILEVDVEFEQRDGHDALQGLDEFDVVLNTGLLYHLQNPMDLLTKLARITRELMYCETEMLTDPAYADHAWFVEGEYCGDPTNWWIYGPRCAERMIRAAGFPDVRFQGLHWTPPAGLKTPEGFDRQGRGAFVCRK